MAITMQAAIEKVLRAANKGEKTVYLAGIPEWLAASLPELCSREMPSGKCLSGRTRNDDGFKFDILSPEEKIEREKRGIIY